ncbi:phosphotransferase [Kribbella sp. NPDC051770]|uniref:phosphotransferase n=1 Tax=Kribbella sp. NPDC051770 TaxID=3155413 RepID=UPI00343E3A2D
MTGDSGKPAAEADSAASRGPTPADLARDYGLTVSGLAAHAGGFESEGWVADGTWFLKVWRAGITPEPSSLDVLRDLQDLGLPVAAPIATASGAVQATWNNRAYAVFPAVQGRPAIDSDWRQWARALRQVHDARPIPAALTVARIDDSYARNLLDRLDQPWIAPRGNELVAAIERLDDVVRRARQSPAPELICHTDFIAQNLLIGSDNQIAAILDWDQAAVAPREHDLWIAAETRHLEDFLTEYGARDLSLVHLEYALLSRALRDLTARILDEVDRPGVQTWGFDRLARLDHDLTRFRPFCAG